METLRGPSKTTAFMVALAAMAFANGTVWIDSNFHNNSKKAGIINTRLVYIEVELSWLKIWNMILKS